MARRAFRSLWADVRGAKEDVLVLAAVDVKPVFQREALVAVADPTAVAAVEKKPGAAVKRPQLLFGNAVLAEYRQSFDARIAR